MSTQPTHDDLRATGKTGDTTTAVAVSGPYLGKRFVRQGMGVWMPAGAATSEEMGLTGSFNQVFADVFGKKGTK